MNIPRRQFLHLAASAAGLLALLGVAWGQAYPMRPVRILLWLRSIPSTKPDMHRLRLPIHLQNHSIGATFHTAWATCRHPAPLPSTHAKGIGVRELPAEP